MPPRRTAHAPRTRSERAGSGGGVTATPTTQYEVCACVVPGIKPVSSGSRTFPRNIPSRDTTQCTRTHGLRHAFIGLIPFALVALTQLPLHDRSRCRKAAQRRWLPGSLCRPAWDGAAAGGCGRHNATARTLQDRRGLSAMAAPSRQADSTAATATSSCPADPSRTTRRSPRRRRRTSSGSVASCTSIGRSSDADPGRVHRDDGLHAPRRQRGGRPDGSRRGASRLAKEHVRLKARSTPNPNPNPNPNQVPSARQGAQARRRAPPRLPRRQPADSVAVPQDRGGAPCSP